MQQELNNVEQIIEVELIGSDFCSSKIRLIRKRNIFQVNGIQDKINVAYFWFTNPSSLFAADIQANPIDISCKKKSKLVYKIKKSWRIIRNKLNIDLLTIKA